MICEGHSTLSVVCFRHNYHVQEKIWKKLPEVSTPNSKTHWSFLDLICCESKICNINYAKHNLSKWISHNLFPSHNLFFGVFSIHFTNYSCTCRWLIFKESCFLFKLTSNNCYYYYYYYYYSYWNKKFGFKNCGYKSVLFV